MLFTAVFAQSINIVILWLGIIISASYFLFVLKDDTFIVVYAAEL